MTTITRLNTTIGDHNIVASFIAFCLLVSVTAAGAVAINQSGDLAKSSYDSLKPSAATAQEPTSNTPAATAKANSQPLTVSVSTGNVVPLSISGQPNVIAELQPAQNTVQDTQATANALQPGSNSIQLTDASAGLQDAATVLQ